MLRMPVQVRGFVRGQKNFIPRDYNKNPLKPSRNLKFQSGIAWNLRLPAQHALIDTNRSFSYNT